MFFGHTEILSMFQIFWNRYFWSYRNSVRVPGKLQPMFEITLIFSERPGNPGIGVLRHYRDLSCIPEILEFLFSVTERLC
jgi:hypothetical protein